MSTGQGEIFYSWYECAYSLILYGTQESFLAFFDAMRSGVTKKGEGYHKDKIDWVTHSSVGGTIPNYLPVADTSYRDDDHIHFSWAVSGFIYVPTTGSYTFGLSVDDAGEVYINDELILNSFYLPSGSNNGAWQFEHTMSLKEGYHKITAGMVNVGGASAFRIGWKKPGDGGINVIPREYFYSHIPASANQVKGVVTKRKQGVSRTVKLFRKDDGSLMNEVTSDEEGNFTMNVEKDVPCYLIAFDELTDDPFQNAKTRGSFTKK